jgi:hypothetical protein
MYDLSATSWLKCCAHKHIGIASTVAVGKAGKGCNPRLNSKAKPFVSLREKVD